MKIRKVLCDLDGVILNYVEAYIKWVYPTKSSTKINNLVSQVTEWDGLLKVTNTTFDDLKNIQNTTKFISTIKPYPWADMLIGKLQNQFGRENVAFLTAVTHHSREEMIEEMYPQIPLFSGHRKEFWAQPDFLLIDDSPPNCEKWFDKGGQFHLFEQPWNQGDEMHYHSIEI